MSDRGDEISDETKEFLLFQNAMAAMAYEEAEMPTGGTQLSWWFLIRRGFEEGRKSYASPLWINWFKQQAQAGDPLAQALIIKVTELRTRQ